MCNVAITRRLHQWSVFLGRKFFLLYADNAKRVICPLCGWTGRGWYGQRRRCPRCNSLPRTRFFAYCLTTNNVSLDRCSVLHIGPNVDEVAYIIQHYTPDPYLRMDIMERPLINAPGDIMAMTYDDASIDVILTWHVLEHIYDDVGAIKEMFRVLRPDGILLLSVPLHPDFNPTTLEVANVDTPKARARTYGHSDHKRNIGLDYDQRFLDVGFTARRTLVRDDVPEPDRLLFSLDEFDVVWKFMKPGN